MADVTVFETPGTFDLRSITIGGLTAKPNIKTPIGKFGTGLKYSVAILLRIDAKLELHCNGDRYSFFTELHAFRDTTYRQCFYKKDNAFLGIRAVKELPYTTHLGEDWELWMAFRELYANTLDENGTVCTMSPGDFKHFVFKEGYTYIVVEHNEFAHLVETRDTIFLPQERELIADFNIGNVSPGRTDHVYYRGMRAKKTDKPTLFTYNIIAEQELTEDRSLKSDYAILREVAAMVEKSDDPEFIKAVITAKPEMFESKLDFSYAFGCSDAFKQAVIDNRHLPHFSSSAAVYYGTYIAPPAKQLIDDTNWNRILEALEEAGNTLRDRWEELINTEDPQPDKIPEHYLGIMQRKFKR